ncbi:unnamed protein product [Meganyctiphanes norvegica]|uniref:Uncharacterized protein n=1 Tax=Meganyctiphanes norvegica TaxID=48144 RepID=A0AAV2Q644_MEGNR
MSPVGVHGGRPPTPQYGPTTPHGAAPFTPHGPTTPQGRPLTPHGPSTPLTNNSTSNFSLGTGNSVPSPASQVPPGQPSKLQEKNKMLVSLLTKEPAQTPPPTAVVPDPRGLPQEKLPKDLKEKLQTPGPWQGGRTDPVILNSLLKQPPSNPRQLKVNTSVAGQLLSGGPHSAPAHMLSQQPSLNSSGSLSQMGSSPLGNTLSGPSLPSSQAQQPGSSTVGTTGVTGGHLINTISSSSGTTTGTTTLPSFSESMGLNPMGNISTTGIPEGGLPSITTATSQFNPIDDNLHEMVINDILEMTGDESSFSSQVSADENKRQYTSPTYDQNENMAIQQIQNSLMSEVDSNSPNVTGAASIPTYNIVTSPSMSSGGYIPQYSPRGPGGGPGGGGNIGTMGPGGLTMRPGAPQFSPNSQGQQRQPFTPQQIAMLRRRQQEEHQLQMKRRLLQKQQMQQIQFSSSADVSQPPTSTYNNIDDLFNNTVAPNVNVTLQRNVSEAASPQSNYGMLHSPLGPSGGGGGGGGGQQQISPGQQQRIPQPPYSPHGSIASPLSNQQQQQSQYNNNLGNQMNYQNPQLSPRHPQGSPAPPNYPGSGGPALPQISPTGPTTPVSSGISPGQGSPAAWPRTSPQHQRIDSLDQRMDQQRPSLQAQNPILNAQLGSVHPNREMNMMSGGATGGRLMGNVRTQLPPINRSMASPNSRGQSPYIGPPTPGSNDGGPFHPSSPQQGTPPLMYQQQSQPQYRMQRTLSAPGQMPENKWGSENVNTSQGGPLSASPRMDDGRGSAGSEKGKSESMLKHLLSK